MNMTLGKQIEITHIDAASKSVGIVIHLYCTPNEAAQPETNKRITCLVKSAIQYLIAEDFLPDNKNNWTTNIGGIIHIQAQ